MKIFLIAILAVGTLAGCDRGATQPYTLYHNSVLDPNMRIHWATFDANDKGIGAVPYNLENCELAAKLLRENLKVENDGREPVRFWCEGGRYRK